MYTQLFFYIFNVGLVEKEDNSYSNNTVSPSTNHHKPSLAKIILSLESYQMKEEALTHLLKALSITYARFDS